MKSLNFLLASFLAFGVGFCLVSTTYLVAGGVMSVLCAANLWAWVRG